MNGGGIKVLLQCIAQLPGKKYIFHTRLGPFTSSPDNNTFTVSGVNKPFTAEVIYILSP